MDERTRELIKARAVEVVAVAPSLSPEKREWLGQLLRTQTILKEAS